MQDEGRVYRNFDTSLLTNEKVSEKWIYYYLLLLHEVQHVNRLEQRKFGSLPNR